MVLYLSNPGTPHLTTQLLTTSVVHPGATSKYFMCAVQLQYIYFIRVLNGHRWVVVDCYEGPRYKKCWKPQLLTGAWTRSSRACG